MYINNISKNTEINPDRVKLFITLQFFRKLIFSFVQLIIIQLLQVSLWHK